ncbi:MAG: hypothetical protein ACLU5I_02735 [Alistipes finegoldii]
MKRSRIYKIEELRKRVIYTIGLLLVYRLGSFVVIPGIQPQRLGRGVGLRQLAGGQRTAGSVERILRRRIRQRRDSCARVMPYITASIIIQLMGMMIRISENAEGR